MDRRLVTNVLLSFLMTPRADAKRFEMLNLLASILSWGDMEREKAGLQRSASSSLKPGHVSKGKGPAELEVNDETEVSFLSLHTHFLTSITSYTVILTAVGRIPS